MPISPPEGNVKRELSRKLFEAIFGLVPLVGGPLAAIYSVTHPAKGMVDVEAWRIAITNQVNEQEAALAALSRTITLSEDAAYLGRWIAEQSETGGRSDAFGYDQLTAAFPDATRLELVDAVGELELEGMVLVSKCLGQPFSHLQPTHKLFEAFDPVVFEGTSPRGDAATIAEVLRDEEQISAEELRARFGWGVRRINPALEIVGSFIADGRKSGPMGQPYTVRAMFPDAGERAVLRRFINEVRGE